MPRQSISFSKPNDEWLKAQVGNEEYSSKSELINDLMFIPDKLTPHSG